MLHRVLLHYNTDICGGDPPIYDIILPFVHIIIVSIGHRVLLYYSTDMCGRDPPMYDNILHFVHIIFVCICLYSFDIYMWHLPMLGLSHMSAPLQQPPPALLYSHGSLE